MITIDRSINYHTPLIIEMVENTMHNAKEFQKQKIFRSLSKLTFKEELCTLKISLPRRAGHTTAALALLNRYPDSYLTILSSSRKNSCLEQFSEFISDIDDVKERLLIIDQSPKHCKIPSKIPLLISDGIDIFQRARFQNNPFLEELILRSEVILLLQV